MSEINISTFVSELPEGWKKEKVKFHLVRRTEKNKANAMVLSVYRELGIVPKDSRDDNHNVTSEDTSKYLYVEPGDFVINKMKAWQGSMAVSEYEGIVSPAYYTYRFRDAVFNKKYFHYLLRSKAFSQIFEQLSGGIRIGQWDLPSNAFENTEVLIPPISTQDAIVKYLDAQSLSIDEAIDRQKLIIEKLEEYKRAFIIDAVSGTCTSNVFKPCKIAWMPDIPVSWKCMPLKFLFGERKHKNSGMQETNLLSLSYGSIKRRDIETNEGLVPESYEGYNIVEKNDIVLRLTDLQNDKKSLRTGLVTERGIVTSAYVTIFPLVKMNASFFRYLLHSYDLKKVFYTMGEGIRQSLKYEDIAKGLILPIPPIEEQDLICLYIHDVESKVDMAIEKKNDTIRKLEEYRKSIIYNAVTGKIDCRGAVK